MHVLMHVNMYVAIYIYMYVAICNMDSYTVNHSSMYSHKPRIYSRCMLTPFVYSYCFVFNHELK